VVEEHPKPAIAEPNSQTAAGTGTELTAALGLVTLNALKPPPLSAIKLPSDMPITPELVNAESKMISSRATTRGEEHGTNEQSVTKATTQGKL